MLGFQSCKGKVSPGRPMPLSMQSSESLVGCNSKLHVALMVELLSTGGGYSRISCPLKYTDIAAIWLPYPTSLL